MRLRHPTAYLLAALALALPVLAQAKLPDGIEMAVDAGYNGVVQLGRVNPLIVTLDNKSANLNLSGDLVLEYSGVEYSTPLELPAPSSKRLYLYFPCEDYSPHLTLRIRTRQYTESFDLYEPANFKTMDARDISIVVLSRQKGSLGALNQVSAGRLYRDLYSDTTAQLGGGRIFVSYFTLDEIEPTPKFFNRADAVVLADIDYQQVTGKLAEALKACAAGGCDVVFSLGLNGAGVSGSPLADFCPLHPSGTVQVGSLGQFGQRYGIQPGDAPATLATGTVDPGARVLDSAGQYSAVVQSRRGSGTVTALAFDFTQAPFKRNPKVAAIFLDNVLPIEDTAGVTSWFIHPQKVADLLNQLAATSPMRPMAVFGFLLAYILLIGPLNFFILDRFKRRTLVWTTIPLIIAAFSTLGLYTGYLSRGANNITATFQELHVFPGSAYVPYQSVMLMFTAERNRYRLDVADESAFLYPDVPQLPTQYGSPPSFISSKAGKIDSTGAPSAQMTQGKWTLKNYTYQGYMGLKTSASSQLSGVPGENDLNSLSGTFSLDLPFDLKYCQLVGPGRFRALNMGDLPGHGTYDVANTKPVSMGYVSSSNYLENQINSWVTLLRDSAEFGLGYRNEVLLVGFTDQVAPLAKVNRSAKKYALSMVVVHLPYRPVLDTPGWPQARTLLIGGMGFDLAGGMFSNPNGYFGQAVPRAAEAQYRYYKVAQGGSLTFDCIVTGTLSSSDYMKLHLAAHEPKHGAELQDLTPWVTLERQEAGGWTPLRLPQGDTVVSIQMKGGTERDRHVRLRLTAQQECVIELPRADF